MAVGVTLVILTAGIDLSVGAVLAFAAMSAAAVLKGTGESRAIPEDPLAFGGFAWLIALLVATGVGQSERERKSSLAFDPSHPPQPLIPKGRHVGLIHTSRKVCWFARRLSAVDG